jgi:hypothetical protein
MWDIFRLSAVGDFTVRKIAPLLAVGIMSALFIAVGHSSIAFADNATWNGDSLSYNNQTYNKDATVTLPGIPQGWDTYIYRPSDQSGTASVIAVEPNADKTKDINGAKKFDFDYDGQTYSNARPPNGDAVTIAAQTGTDANGNAGGENKNKTSCDVQGIGWIVCSTSRFIAGAMDRVYGWIDNFLTVKPLTTDTSSGLFQAWAVARGLANAAFIVAFLVIIYSQITSVGISNYEIKKMVPRLIIAAILVNVSYFICAIGVDISNILGENIQAALMQIRNALPAPFPDGDWWRSWEKFTEIILSGGTIGATGAVLAMTGGATGGAISALAALLVPVLIAGILSVLVALMVLAARQALITVLIVVSPLAFVAFLLPNTEKYFDKWRSLLLTMLMVFPMFSLLFGGSQLASYIIIQNTNQLSVVILALFVQVAPLALTPFLIRFSGSLLGKFAGMLNNPQKGLVDRSRNWAKDRADTLAKRRMAMGENSRNPLALGRIAHRRDATRRKWADSKKRYDTELGASWSESKTGQYIASRVKDAELRASVGSSGAELLHEERRETSPSLRQYSGQQRQNTESAKMLQGREEADWNEMKSRNMTAGNPYANRAPVARMIQEEQRVSDGRVSAAQAMQQSEHAVDLIKSESLQRRVGGIADHGDQRALASAVSQYRKDYNDRINDANAILKHYNFSGQQRQDHALGKTVWVEDDNNNMKAFRADSLFTREAAIDYQMRVGTYDQLEQIIQVSGSDLQKFRTTISSAMAEAKVNQKAVFLGGRTIDRVSQGQIPSQDVLMQVVTETIAKGKISAQDLATNEDTALTRIYEAVRDRSQYETALAPPDRAKLDDSIAQLFETADTVLHTPQISNTLKKNSKDVLNRILSLRPPQTGSGTP